MKRALITGITGQDGAYLAKLLVAKGYSVFGTAPRIDDKSTARLAELGVLSDIQLHPSWKLHDEAAARLLDSVGPDEIYNLAGRSLVSYGDMDPANTIVETGAQPAYLIDVLAKTRSSARFYQASSSEMFGSTTDSPQSESTPFRPRNPYGIAKLCAHWSTVLYRERQGGFACSGILFNHESALRDPLFVTRKITLGFARIFHGKQETVEIGNLDAVRDWGWAEDYVEGMWRMLQVEDPSDFVLATGVPHTIRGFAEAAGSFFGWDLLWQGTGFDEVGLDRKTGKLLVRIDPVFWREPEPVPLVGDPAKAERILGWRHKRSMCEVAEAMCAKDVERVAKGTV
jgi:GDPmannose 4,6-dehydratase